MDNPKQFKTLSKEAGLFIVSTPIGNLADITYRAVNVLKAADLLLCEDTRVTRNLLSHYAIAVKCESYNDHNEDEKRPGILKMLQSGMMIALVSDAGTPLVSDPGYKLVRAALNEGIKVHPVPGPSAIMAGIVMSGMPSDVFTFCGFAQSKKFKNFRTLDSTLIFFESAKRLVKTLTAMQKTFAGRSVAVCREVTKLFEEVKSGSFAEVIDYYTAHPPKGEIVILLSPAAKVEKMAENYQSELKSLLKTTKLKAASEIIGEKYNINKKKVYELGLALKNN